jgi:hypothetical protein
VDLHVPGERLGQVFEQTGPVAVLGVDEQVVLVGQRFPRPRVDGVRPGDDRRPVDRPPVPGQQVAKCRLIRIISATIATSALAAGSRSSLRRSEPLRLRN